GIQAGAALAPPASGEVGDLHGAPGAQRLPGQGHGGAPGGGVVDVDIGDEAQPHALHRAVDEHVVHSAVPAVVLRIVADVLPQPVVVLVQVRLGVGPGVVFVVRLDVDPGRVVLQESPRSAEGVDPAVRTRRADVVLGPDQSAFLGADHAGDPVAGDVLL